MATIPIITIGTPTKTKISRVTGYDRSVVTFTSDKDLNNWETRATRLSETPALGFGLLVESGTTLSANTEATIYVDDEELAEDNEYKITVYGHGSNGYWSDGTYDEVNLINLSTNIVDSWDITITGNRVTITSGDKNNTSTSRMATDSTFWTDGWSNAVGGHFGKELGVITVNFRKVSTIDWVNISLVGNVYGGAILLSLKHLKNGTNYILSYNVESLSLNSTTISNIKVVEAG